MNLATAYEKIASLDGRVATGNYEPGIALTDGDCYHVARGVHNYVRGQFGLNSQRTVKTGLDSLGAELARPQVASYLVQICNIALTDLNDEQNGNSGTWGHLFVVLQAGVEKSVYQGFAEGYTLGEWVRGEFTTTARAPNRRYTPANGCPMSDLDFQAWLLGVRTVVAGPKDERVDAAKDVFGCGGAGPNFALKTSDRLELLWVRRTTSAAPPAADPPARTGLFALVACLFPQCFPPQSQFD